MKSSPQKMRILELTTNFKQGGIQRHILDLTAHLRASGHEVMLAGAPNVWGSTETDSDFIPLRLDLVSAVNPSLPSRMKAAFDCAQQLRHILKELEIELIHSHETAPAMVARLALGTRKLPTVITYHGSAPTRTKQFAKISRYCADTVCSPSQTTLNQLIEFGVPRERTKVLGLGIDYKPTPADADVSRLKHELNLVEDDVTCLSLSRLDYQKGIDIMIDVAKQALAQNPKIVFLVGGTGPLADEVGGWADTAGISDRFRFLGSISNVETYLAAADIFLLTSRWEALPISIVEAFRAGLPVIATNCGGVAELVNDEVGRLCEVGDVEGICSAVLELASQPKLRLELSQNALDLSTSNRFDPDHVHAAYEQMYRSILGR